MNLSIFNLKEVQEFMQTHQGTSPEKLAIKYHGKTDFPLNEVLLQLSLAKKAEEKLPTWKNHGCVFSRPGLEQATSEELACWKAELFKPLALVDITAGLGVDAWAIGKHLTHENRLLYELHEPTAKLLEWNFERLGLKQHVLARAATLAEIDQWPSDALVYIDPDRRVDGQRSLEVNAWSPDLFEWIPAILQSNRAVLVKFSPMVDLHWIEQTFPGKKHLYVLGKEREVKEVLVHFNGPKETYRGDPLKRTALVVNKGKRYQFDSEDDHRAEMNAADILEYPVLFDPHNAVVKAGLTAVLAKFYALHFFNRKNSYLLGEAFIHDFPGRQFQIKNTAIYKPDSFKLYLKNNHINGAGINCKDFPDTPEHIRKRFKLKESQFNYFAFTKNAKGEFIVIHGIPYLQN